jgi:hypothetical protein
MNTALTVIGMPAISKFNGSSIPSFDAKFRFTSPIIGKGKLAASILGASPLWFSFPYLAISANQREWDSMESQLKE